MNIVVDDVYRFKFDGKYPREVSMFKDNPDQSHFTIHLPEPPALKDIDGRNLSTTSQKFIRHKPPADYYDLIKRANGDRNELYRILWRNASKYNQLIKWIEREWDRRLNGYWFYNHGVITYITGTNYFYTRWWELDDGPPDYRDRDMLSFYFWDLVVVPDKNCLGEIYMKHRREGATFRAQCKSYEFVSRTKLTKGGIQSRDEGDAKKVFKDKLVQPWKRLPFFFQPITSSSTDPAKELVFSLTAKRGGGSLHNNIALDSKLVYEVSDEGAFDGDKLHRYHLDECGKMTKVDPNETWRITKTCLTTGADGKGMLTSTVGEMSSKGGRKFKTLWDESDIGDRPRNGKTISGLYRLFIPAYIGLQIEGGKKFYDEYGNSNIEEAQAHLNSEIEAFRKSGNTKALSEQKRQYPRTVREAFTSGLSRDYFDTDKLQKRLEEFVFGNKYLRIGRFEWIDSNDWLKGVRFVDDKNGRFKVSYLFDDISRANRYVKRGHNIFPANTIQFIAGADPFKYNDTRGSRRSLGGGGVKMKRDYMTDPDTVPSSEWKTDKFVCTYLARPKTVDLYCEDMLMMCVYYGCKMFPEIDVDHVWTYFVRHGYAGYLLFDKNERNRLKTTPGANTREKLVEEMFKLFAQYVSRAGDREVHDDLIQQLLEVQFESITDFDLFVACGYALLGEQRERVIIKDKKEKEEENVRAKSLHTKYRYTLHGSVKI